MKKQNALLCYLLLLLTTTSAVADDSALTPMQRHMQYLHNVGDQWRTPNPAYDAANGGPREYGLRFNLSADGSHMTGNLTGIYEDGREPIYWTLLSFYNPVTGKVITKQIGSDGTLLLGENPLQEGRRQIVDMLHFGADGSLSASRHENTYESKDRHSSVVLEPDGLGGWSPQRRWTWKRVADTGEASSEVREVEPGPIARHTGFLLEGSGRWRSPNPDYNEGSDNEKFYGMNYRWGPHRQHVIGEIVGIYADGREEKIWSLFMTHNPVTGEAVLEQTGGNGVYFRGELGVTKNGHHSQQGLIFLPNGQVKSVRDEVEILDTRHYRSRVFERDESGGWRNVRNWIWTRQDAE